ncbi:MAG: hypothetical protein DCC49_05880 [Acidobacteria bacterium]|nr:MAG: hypothetical protein DCC49_05880 [Acidobacteriota bacterium]
MRGFASRVMREAGSRIGHVARFGRWGVLPHYLFTIVVVLTLMFATVLPIKRLLAEGEREAEIRREIEAVRANSMELSQKIDELNDPAVIESQARSRLGLVRSGETPLIVTEGPLPDPAPPSAKPKPKPNPKPPAKTATPKPTSTPKASPTPVNATKPKPSVTAKR